MESNNVKEDNGRDIIVSKLKNTKLNGVDLIFGMIAGSCAFNLNVATSDRDYFAIYLASLDDVLSLTPPPESYDAHDPDVAVYEALKFLMLILKGNPKVIEPLFTEHLCFQTEAWEDLKKVRKCVLSQNTVDQYVGYALGKVKDFREGKGTDTKNFYHALRLLNEAKRIVDGGNPNVWIDGKEREFLMEVRKGIHQPEKLMKIVDELKSEIELKKSALPKEVCKESPLTFQTDEKPLHEWLVKMRLKNLRVEDKMPTPLPSTTFKLRKEAEDLLTKFSVPGQILCVIPSGSKCYGVSGMSTSCFFDRTVEDSSDDYIGIYIAPIKQIASMHPPVTRIDSEGRESQQKINFARGLCLFEVTTACELMGAGNHRLLEALLYDGKDSFETEEWQALKSIRNTLITQQLVNNCFGVVEGKLKSIKDNTPDSETFKIHYQALRMLTQAEKVLQGFEYSVVLPSDEKELLLKVRKGEINKSEVQELITKKQQSISQLRKSSKTPPKTDRNKMSDWLVKLRKGEI